MPVLLSEAKRVLGNLEDDAAGNIAFLFEHRQEPGGARRRSERRAAQRDEDAHPRIADPEAAQHGRHELEGMAIENIPHAALLGLAHQLVVAEAVALVVGQAQQRAVVQASSPTTIR